ncbi:unnamed protein product [Xylocopa violacea]|uniref:Uncharacterized protein n=1 Tax=Xylocopa violacea TaxID=135666 RepID=A0ABP1NKY9_XYLVO
MEAKFAYTKQNPQKCVNPISRLFLGWTKGIFLKGAKGILELSDLYHPLKEDESKVVTDRLEKFWNWELQKWEQKQKEMPYDEKLNKKKNTPRLEKALIRAFWKEYFCIGLLTACQYAILSVIMPLIISWIISYFKIDDATNSITKAEALSYGGYLILCLVLTVFVMHHSDLLSQEMGMKLRVACSSLVYRKMLRLSKVALNQITSGQVVNILSNDVSRFDEMCYYLNFIWITPIQIIVITVILWYKVGVSSLIGIGALLLITLPSDSIFIALIHKMRKVVALMTDKRVQLMNELINGIQVIKMYAWEEPFDRIVASIRANEITKIRHSIYIRGVYLAFVVFTTRVVLFITLSSYVLLGNIPRADLTFMLSSYFEVLQLTSTLLFPQALMLTGETLVSIKRLEELLLLQEQPRKIITSAEMHQNGQLKFKKKKQQEESIESIGMKKAKENSKLNDPEERPPVSITLKRVSANWTADQLPPTLCNVSMKVQGGELCLLVGPVGSGKSSILQLLLNELPLGAGNLSLYYNTCQGIGQDKVVDTSNFQISYASQEAWLFSGTIRENILFGQPYDKDRYMAVTKACALIKDFQQFPYGDMSNVGESGSALSGGQRARINLARAVYRQADIYLFDDPLSAVDARVAKHLFNKCIKVYLRGKTRIVATHQLQFVKQADNIAGSIKMQGSYEELSKSHEDFLDMINRIKSSVDVNKQNEKTEAIENSFLDSTSTRKSRVSTASNTSSVNSYNYENQELAPENNETTALGSFSHKVYTEYFRFGGSCFVLTALVAAFVISQAATTGNDYWVSYWINLEIIRKSVQNGTYPFNPQYYSYVLNGTYLSNVFNLDKYGLMTIDNALYVYTFCIVCCVMTVFAKNIFFMKVCLDASENLHKSMFSNVLRAVMTFFHHNNSGRILNRFSKDVGAMDEILPRVTLETIQIILVIIGILLMVVIVNNWMLIPLVVLSIFFFFGRIWFLKTTQSVKRLEGATKSPIFSHVNATLNGLATIRSSGSDIMELLQKQFDDLQDVHTGTWYMTIVIPVAFGLYLDILVVIFITCVCFSFILMNTGDTLAGNVGLAISQSLIMIGTLQYGVKQSGEMVANMTSVERILQYTNLPKESSWTSNNPPPADWPQNGQVTLKNVSMRYDKDEPPVLKNLNVTIEAGWKVGVVGRTGAGKSSLISALFRLFAEGLEGEIKIDDRDTSTLGLHELRSQISIIPQLPFLFSQTLRYNLDPFNTYDDKLLWDSLRQVELNDLTLDQKVAYSGSNLSNGERQLICLARAILRNNRILILDEATANIDPHTDNLIQRTIRTIFANCTVITIAHRLNTIIDSDRVIVMDTGNIVEFGCPYELLRDKPQGVFSQMVNNTGASMSQSLRDQAEMACMKNTRQISLNFSQRSSTSEEANVMTQSSL